MRGLFLCGCDPNDERVRNYNVNQVTVSGITVLSGKRYDKRGNEICPIHGKPKYGFLTPLKQGPQGNEVIDLRQDMLLHYGPQKPTEILSTVLDLRDNRDPEEVGNEYLASRAVRANGHSEPPPGPARWGSD